MKLFYAVLVLLSAFCFGSSYDVLARTSEVVSDENRPYFYKKPDLSGNVVIQRGGTSEKGARKNRDSDSWRERESEKERASNIYDSVPDSEEVKGSCATEYIAALDKECYNPSNVSSGGVYADCSDYTINDYYDAMDMQLARVVEYDDLEDFIEDCSPYKEYAFSQWMQSKEIIERSAVKSSGDCVIANLQLQAAQKCYAAALAHDGNFFDFDSVIKANCGDHPEVARQFIKSGDLGMANLPQMMENYSTLQFTSKSENWRSAIEATFSGYIYKARNACGNESYDIIQLNTFTPDSRENLMTVAKEGFASQLGKQAGSRVSNLIATSKPTAGKPVSSINTDTLAGKATASFYKQMGWEVGENERDDSSYGYDDDFSNSSQLGGSYVIQNIYTIEGVANINSARARLMNILQTGDVGTENTQDALDVAIVAALGGRVGDTNAMYSILSGIKDNDVFLIKQVDGYCQALILRNGNLAKLSGRDVANLPSLTSYMSGCSGLSE